MQARYFAWAGPMRGLQRDAFGPEIAEHGLDRRSLTIVCDRMMRPAATGQPLQFTEC
jgi:hypothetical protein